MRTLNRPGQAALGVMADWALGEPAIGPHPVAVFGRVMRRVEQSLYDDHVLHGVAHAAVGVGLGTAAGAVLRSTAVATYLAVAGRALRDAATEVAQPLLEGDVERARELLPALVGRDPSGLDEKEIARAVVESVAENTVDAVVAPALWGAVGGAPGALSYRAINTLDAMVGHRSPRYARYGTASARLDDAANYIPARVSAALVMVARPRRRRDIGAALRAAGSHPSPNAGVAEAAFAGALGLRLGGTNRYGERVEVRPALGHGRPASAADVQRACRLSFDVSAALVLALAVAEALSG